MASLNGFYEVVSTEGTAESWVSIMRLNQDHDVYQGHFPGKPVAPGAALTQMVLDEVAKQTDNRRVSELRQIKFLTVIDPTQVNELELAFEMKERKGVEMFTCLGKAGETNYFKLNGIFS
jgi:3-hydroxyacyl-[acyl-carrier-protein] dehydratase